MLVLDALGMTLTTLHRSTGLARTHLYRFAKETAKPSGSTLERFTEATGASVDYVLTGHGPMWRDAPDDPYRNRVKAVGIVHDLGFPEAAIATVKAMDPGSDQTTLWWLEELFRAKNILQGVNSSQGPVDGPVLDERSVP